MGFSRRRRRRTGLGITNKKQRKSCENNGNTLISSFIPGDIMFDILIRIPCPRTLTSFKMVCKLWRSIIGSREFSKAHFKKWQSNHSKPEVVVSQVTSDYDYDFASLDIGGSNTFHPLSLTAFVKHKDGVEVNVRVLDSLDGLVLFYVPEFGKNRLYVCNPLTRRLIKLHFVIPSFWESDQAILHFKLVFDSALLKYKVLGFCCKYRKLIDSNYCLLILNAVDEEEEKKEGRMTTPIWRKTESIFRLSDFNPIAINGSLYWIAYTIEGDYVHAYIQSMDIVSEELMKDVIPLPSQPQNKYWGNCRLVHIELLKDTLCVAIPRSHTDLGIWVLEDWDNLIWINIHDFCWTAIASYYGSYSFVNSMFHILFAMDDDDYNSLDEMKFIVAVNGNLCSCTLKSKLLTEITARSSYFAYVPSLNTWD